jgi:glycosyltransferase involved in cell wall biosynthesis/SAM-dependent methyltransferase
MTHARHCDEYWSRAATPVARAAAKTLLGAQVAAQCERGPVLDLGCGDGALTEELARRGCDVVGLDASQRAIAIAQRRLPGKFVVADMCRAPFADGSFDTVIAVESAEWLGEEDVPGLVAEMFRLTRKRACLWIATGDAAGKPPARTVRSRLWWEQRLLEQGFAACGITSIALAAPPIADAVRFALVVERPANGAAAGRSPASASGVAATADLIRERDATIRALKLENRHLAGLIASKNASFAMVATEVDRLEAALLAQRNSNWSRLGDALRQPLGMRMIKDAGGLALRVARNRLQRRRSAPPVAAEAPLAPAIVDEQAALPARHAPYVVRMPVAEPGDRPRVVHVIANFMTGGSSRLVIDLIERLGSRYDQRVLTSYVPDPAAYVGPRVDVLPLGATERAFAKHLADASLTHVHYWGEGDEPWYRNAFAAASGLACPVVENVNTPVAPFRSSRVARYVFVSDYVRKEFGRADDQAEVIYPGSDLRLFEAGSRETDDGNTIGMVYRMERDKLDEHAIDAFILAVRARPRTRAVIVGGGSLLPEFRRRVRVAGLDDRFTFTDYVAYVDLPALYAGMTLFVAPVWKESFGQVSVFAMAAGVPVVGYATGAIPEIVADGELVVPFGDSRALADLVVRLLDDPVERKAISERNRERAQAHYSVDAMVASYARLYGSLLGRDG